MRFSLSAVFLFFSLVIVSAQEMDITGNGTATDVLRSTNTTGSAADRIGVRGVSMPTPYWGIGLQGDGGYIGTAGYATMSGNGGRYGGYFYASGGDQNYGVYGFAPTIANSYAGFFQGNVYVQGTVTQASDLRLKKNVIGMSGALEKVMKLKAVKYEFDDKSPIQATAPKGEKFGFIAQEIEAVYPQLVQDVQVPVSFEQKASKAVPASYKAVDYTGLIPVLLNAIQEQQAQIKDLKARLDVAGK